MCVNVYVCNLMSPMLWQCKAFYHSNKATWILNLGRQTHLTFYSLFSFFLTSFPTASFSSSNLEHCISSLHSKAFVLLQSEILSHLRVIDHAPLRITTNHTAKWRRVCKYRRGPRPPRGCSELWYAWGGISGRKLYVLRVQELFSLLRSLLFNSSSDLHWLHTTLDLKRNDRAVAPCLRPKSRKRWAQSQEP